MEVPIEDDLPPELRRPVEAAFERVSRMGDLSNVEAVTAEHPDRAGDTPRRTGQLFHRRRDDELRFEVFVNPERADEGRRNFYEENWGLDRFEETATHELVHAAHSNRLEREGYPKSYEWKSAADKAVIERNVPDVLPGYATKNPGEMVAIVGTRLAHGMDVPDDVMRVYRKYGGPEPR